MRRFCRRASPKHFGFWLAAALLLLPQLLVLARAAGNNRRFRLSGYPGDITAREIDGNYFVEVRSLAKLAGGSLSSRGDQIILTLPNLSSHEPSGGHAAVSGMSRDFLEASIEQMSVIREWRSTLIGAVQHGYPVTAEWMATFSDEAQKNLRLVSVTVSSETERKVLELLTNEFNNMKALSDRFVKANISREYMPTNALENDPLDQKILSCGHSLATIAATGEFLDDGSCH